MTTPFMCFRRLALDYVAVAGPVVVKFVDFFSTGFRLTLIHLQSYLNTSNTDGSFTMANSDSFLSPHGILPMAKEKKYFSNFSYFIMKLYVVCTH